MQISVCDSGINTQDVRAQPKAELFLLPQEMNPGIKRQSSRHQWAESQVRDTWGVLSHSDFFPSDLTIENCWWHKAPSDLSHEETVL